jgi:hypothetical protein
MPTIAERSDIRAALIPDLADEIVGGARIGAIVHVDRRTGSGERARLPHRCRDAGFRRCRRIPGRRIRPSSHREGWPKHLPRPGLPHSRGCLLPRRGFLWWRCRLLPASPLRSRRIEGIFAGLTCVESHCLAGCDFDALSGLWIPPLACGARRHIENAEAGDTNRLAGQEGIKNGVYHGLHRLARRYYV